MKAVHFPLLALALGRAVDAASCVTEDGTAVDWWFMLKYPSSASSSCAGACYSYLDSSTLTWTESSKLVTDTDSLLGQQLAAVYAKEAGLDYVMYNDQWPNGDWTEDYGHSKGTFAFDASSGWFMQHSIPDFPNYVADGYLYGSSQLKYGQLASCVSYSLSSFDSIAYALRFGGPWIYDTSLDSTSTSGNMSQLLAGNTFYNEVDSVDLPLTSSGGLAVSFMAKTGSFGADMADKVVDPNLGGVGLWSQSWLNSCTKVGAYCPTADDNVVDVLESQYGDDTTAWPTYNDHAKWAITPSGTAVCVMDNNRCTSQYKRGGLAQCFDSAALHEVLSGGTLSVDSCDGTDDGESNDDDRACCHYDDSSCNTGDVCCYSNCYDPSSCSYSESGCSGDYGQLHDCQWQDGTCVVGSGSGGNSTADGPSNLYAHLPPVVAEA